MIANGTHGRNGQHVVYLWGLAGGRGSAPKHLQCTGVPHVPNQIGTWNQWRVAMTKKTLTVMRNQQPQVNESLLTVCPLQIQMGHFQDSYNLTTFDQGTVPYIIFLDIHAFLFINRSMIWDVGHWFNDVEDISDCISFLNFAFFNRCDCRRRT